MTCLIIDQISKVFASCFITSQLRPTSVSECMDILFIALLCAMMYPFDLYCLKVKNNNYITKYKE